MNEMFFKLGCIVFVCFTGGWMAHWIHTTIKIYRPKAVEEKECGGIELNEESREAWLKVQKEHRKKLVKASACYHKEKRLLVKEEKD